MCIRDSNYIDTYHRSGLYPLKLPIGLGLEGAGVITDVGENVKDFKVGDKISYAGIPLGSYSTHRNYPTKNLVKVPDDIDLEIAATLMTKGLTTFYLLHKTFPVKSGQTILFHAAAGGVGQIFGQWAKSLGCIIFGTLISDNGPAAFPNETIIPLIAKHSIEPCKVSLPTPS